MKRALVVATVIVLLGIIPSISRAGSTGAQQITYGSEDLQQEVQNLLQKINQISDKQGEDADILDDMRSLLEGDLISLEEARGNLNDELREVIKRHIRIMNRVLEKMK